MKNGKYRFDVVVEFKKVESDIKLEPEQHKIFINSIVINFVPMQVEYIDESFKPCHLLFFPTRH